MFALRDVERGFFSSSLSRLLCETIQAVFDQKLVYPFFLSSVSEGSKFVPSFLLFRFSSTFFVSTSKDIVS